MIAAMLAPFVIGAIFLRAPVLPAIAIEVRTEDASQPPRIVRGHVITVDDRMTTVLDTTGTVQFVLNEQVVSKTLCQEPGDAPTSIIDVHGWLVEQTSLEWIAPARDPQSPDPRCQGRPVAAR